MLKQNVARELRFIPRPVAKHVGTGRTQSNSFWLPRYFDFNVRSEEKMVEKLRYIHNNPVNRGLVADPVDWEWSSCRHYAAGFEGIVEIESRFTARKRERTSA
jgi:putative transposase